MAGCRGKLQKRMICRPNDGLAIACWQVGKDYVGCEVDSAFYDAAYSRIFDKPTTQPEELFLPLI